MKINISELTGVALDWAVAECEKPEWLGNQAETYVKCCSYSPSTKWAQGGPIIERARIQVRPMRGVEWDCYLGQFGKEGTGTTALIAAMRCYVASKLGDEIEIPDSLV